MSEVGRNVQENVVHRAWHAVMRAPSCTWTLLVDGERADNTR